VENNRKQAAERMKQQHDKHIKPSRQYQPGDRVYLGLSMNRPSAPELIKAVISSVFSTVSTLIGIENCRFEIDHTVT
jgi:hypothetical protein